MSKLEVPNNKTSRLFVSTGTVKSIKKLLTIFGVFGKLLHSPEESRKQKKKKISLDFRSG